MREVLFSQRQVCGEEGENLLLRYYMTLDKGFGVKIIMQKSADSCEENVQIDDIFTNLLEIKELLVVLSRCAVTPCSLFEIMDDYLAK